MNLPDFSEEKRLWRDGFELVLGIDEVGRGSWAGPVVVGACVFVRGPLRFHPHPTSWSRLRPGAARWGTPAFSTPRLSTSESALKEILALGINDSKALGCRKREQLSKIIKDCSLWAIAEVGVGTINRVGIGKATEMAMRQAIKGIIYKVASSDHKCFVLVDAFHIHYLKGFGLKNQKAIVKGDQKSVSIAAASILAKVYRDGLMRRLAKRYKFYGVGRNKGYGTREHQQAILRHGVTRVHRRAFVATFLAKTKFSRGGKTE